MQETFHTIYPWQSTQWQNLMVSFKANRLPHALLFQGATGLGKKHFTFLLAEILLCHRPFVTSCGQCHSCVLLKGQSHPDFLWIEPLQAGHAIKIDQIRGMIPWIYETALQGGLRIVVINEAHRMNQAAANALLKTLEEPPPRTMLILISDQCLRLPKTILSRCQKVIFNKPSESVAMDWLKKVASDADHSMFQIALNFAQNAPLKAQEFLLNGFLSFRTVFNDGFFSLAQQKDDPIQFAAQCQEQDILSVFQLLFSLLHDLLRWIVTNGKADLTHFDYRETFEIVIKKISQEKIIAYYDYVKKIYAYKLSGLNLNNQLMLEELFIKWAQYATR